MPGLALFWKALDELPAAATDARDWRQRLGAEFAAARRYLRATGEVVDAIDCPSPGGDGCPRSVVRLPSGRLRAVCRSETSRCPAIDIEREDIAVLALDLRALGADLATAFSLTRGGLALPRGRVLRLGDYEAAAGLSAPVLLALPGPRDPLIEEEFSLAGLGRDQAVVLTPRASSLPPPTRAKLTSAGHLLLGLAETTQLAASGALAAVQPVEVLLGPVRQALLDRLDAVSGAPRLRLPPGTDWGAITLTLTCTATLICSGPGVSRQMDPGEFGMRSQKNNTPTIAWVLLVQIIAAGGVLRSASPALDEQVKKQKQELATRLRRTLGINSDPLPWNKAQRCYVARFLVRDERPKDEREQRRRR